MKKILTTIVIASAAISARAELTSKHFIQLEQWAAKSGYFLQGTDSDFGVKCFLFANPKTNVFGLVPVSSDTADEAINALIASTATYRKLAALQTKEQVANPAPAAAAAAQTLDVVQPSAPAPEPLSTSEAVEVTANEIHQAYEDNQIVADQRFQGKEIVVTGTIDDIKRGIDGQPHVTLETGTYWSVKCMFYNSDTAILSRLSKGQKIRIAGRVASTTMNVVVERCRILNQLLSTSL
jgi:putative nucleic acid binding protein